MSLMLLEVPVNIPISESAAAEIKAKLPDLHKISKCLLFDSLVIARQAGPNSSLDIAATCYRDAYVLAVDSHSALDRAYRSLVWFREEDPEGPHDFSAVHWAKYYADDVALRLYASAEHIGAFIAHYLPIPRNELSEFKKKLNKKDKVTVSSTQAVVGQYMIKNCPGHKITSAINKLREDLDWKGMRNYRDRWVHKQAPLLEGMGDQYERKPRWVDGKHFNRDAWLTGDKPSLTIEALLEIITKAFIAYEKCLSELFDVLLAAIESLGIGINFDRNRISFPGCPYIP
jgi:hypothetical protein